MEKENGKKRSNIRHIAAAAATLIIIAAAILLFMYRDKLTAEGLREIFTPSAVSARDDIEAFTYETGADEMFAVAGNGLAVVSSSGMQLMDADGKTVAKQIFSLSTPAVAASAQNAAFFDVGGTTLRVSDFEGNVTNLDTGTAIISVSVNKNGWLAVVTEEGGYKALVTVYNAALEPVYQWHSGTAYILKASVSPDNKSVAALTAGYSGGGVSIFALDKEEPTATYVSGAELFFDICYSGNDTICAVSESRLLFMNPALEEKGEYSFGDLYLTQYSLDGDGFISLLLSKYRSGNSAVLVNVGLDGTVFASMDIQRDLVSLSAKGTRLLAYYSDELVLYTRELESEGGHDDVVGLRAVLLRDKGDCLLISPYSAQLHKF